MPLLYEQLPKHLADKVVERVRMNLSTPGQQLIDTTLDALRRARGQTEREAEAILCAVLALASHDTLRRRRRSSRSPPAR